MTPQMQRVLTHLKKKGSINPILAWTDLGVYRLSDVIFKLREEHEIKTQRTNGFNRFQEKVNYATYVYKGVKND